MAGKYKCYEIARKQIFLLNSTDISESFIEEINAILYIYLFVSHCLLVAEN